MSDIRYKFTDKEMKILLSNLCIVVDTREQVNQHIISYFDKKKIKYTVRKLDQGDYSCYIESNEETIPLGVIRDWYFDNNIAIERKNSVDELIQSIKDRDRFENEFCRLNKYGIKSHMIIEDKDFYTKLATGDYRSEYKKESAIASYETLISRYDIKVHGHDKKEVGYRIHKICYYFVRELFKNKGYLEE
ncbi:ERCC4 domain-containing protein [Clostridium tertium]